MLPLFPAVCVLLLGQPAPQAPDTTVFLELETTWNTAHIQGDTIALARLWADDMTITVPEMPMMTKAEVFRFWRSGRSTITRYETSDLRVRLYASTAIVTGRLIRERDFNGRQLVDDWQFTKVYVRRQHRWQVVAYQASPSPA
jgi:ketosteroid isomerase-like protein